MDELTHHLRLLGVLCGHNSVIIGDRLTTDYKMITTEPIYKVSDKLEVFNHFYYIHKNDILVGKYTLEMPSSDYLNVMSLTISGTFIDSETGVKWNIHIMTENAPYEETELIIENINLHIPIPESDEEPYYYCDF